MHASGRAVYESDRGRDWKLIVRKKEPRELYDLAADPSERHDLAAEHPEVVERLAAVAVADAVGDAKAVPEDLKEMPH